jgi:hypothetical protein
VAESPIEQLLRAFDQLDVDGAMALAAPDVRLLTADGRTAQGAPAARELIENVIASLRSTSHRITSQWHLDGVWIAEVYASYEMSDWLALNDLPRAFIVRTNGEQICDLRVYGAHERRLTDHRTGDEGLRVGDRWIPPL